MENDFFDLYEKQNGFELDVGHNKTADWCINITDRKGKTISEHVNPQISVQNCDRKKAFAMAYDKFTDYLLQNRRGY